MAKIYHFSGAGNDFVVLDGRWEDLSVYRQPATIGRLCDEYGTDGLMILSLCNSDTEVDGAKSCERGDFVSNKVEHKALDGGGVVDFTMEFYNPDGSSGMMCGNGGRCIAAFADYLGISAAVAKGNAALSVAPANGGEPSICWASADGEAQVRGDAAPIKRYLFRAADGVHTAEILERAGERKWLVRLGMRDVEGVQRVLDGYFLNTGTRHFVKFVPDVEAIDIDAEALPIRHNPLFAPEGTNVNFVQIVPGGIKVRTFEKGVEGETLACGTGITASAIAAVFSGRLAASAAVGSGEAAGDAPFEAGNSARGATGCSIEEACVEAAGDADGVGATHRVAVRARREDLEVDFTTDGCRFSRVFLTGPAELL